jgi:transposase
MMLKTFVGHLQADAYAGYDALYRSNRVFEVGCWGHARRKIWDIHQAKATATTTELLERIAGLYAVEEQVRGQPPDVRCSARQLQSKPQLGELRRRMEAIRLQLSAKSTLAVAITYALKRWVALTRYIDDGRVWRLITSLRNAQYVALSIGRRNWLFAGSKAGGERAAAIYSIIETCKVNGVEPLAYITDVMQKIASDWPNSRIDELMPWKWSEPARPTAP